MKLAARHKTNESMPEPDKRKKQLDFSFSRTHCSFPFFAGWKNGLGADKNLVTLFEATSVQGLVAQDFSLNWHWLWHAIPKYIDRESDQNCYFVTGHELEGIFFQFSESIRITLVAPFHCSSDDQVRKRIHRTASACNSVLLILS